MIQLTQIVGLLKSNLITERVYGRYNVNRALIIVVCAQINAATRLADGWDWQVARNGYLAGKGPAFVFAAVQVSMPLLAKDFWNFRGGSQCN